MKRVWFILIFAGIVYFIFDVASPRYKFRYYYDSKDSPKILTRVTYSKNLFHGGNHWFYPNDVYLVPGFYDKHKIPKAYVKPIENSEGQWAEYITFHSKGIYIIGQTAETKNTSDSFFYINGSVKDYSESRKIDSIEATFKDTENIALYSFKK